MQRCTFCNQSILDGVHQTVTEGGNIYHEKCHASAVGSRRDGGPSAEAQAEEERRRQAHASHASQPKTIGGGVTLEEKRGFTIDPVTGQKKLAGKSMVEAQRVRQ